MNEVFVKLSRSEQVLAEKTMCILLLRGDDVDGGKIYAYVAIRADKLEEFMAAQKKGVFYPEEYGVIIESGSGEPSDEVKQKMTSEYGFNHESMVDIPNIDKAQELTSELLRVSKPQE
jgi:hypothetical protein